MQALTNLTSIRQKCPKKPPHNENLDHDQLSVWKWVFESKPNLTEDESALVTARKLSWVWDEIPYVFKCLRSMIKPSFKSMISVEARVLITLKPYTFGRVHLGRKYVRSRLSSTAEQLAIESAKHSMLIIVFIVFMVFILILFCHVVSIKSNLKLWAYRSDRRTWYKLIVDSAAVVHPYFQR